MQVSAELLDSPLYRLLEKKCNIFARDGHLLFQVCWPT